CPATTAAPACSTTNNLDNQNEDEWTARFRILVQNTGNEVLHNVKVTDPKAAGCTKTIGTLAPGASTTYLCTNTRQPVRLGTGATDCGYLNQANVAGTSPEGKVVTAFNRSGVLHKPPCKTG